MASRSGGIESCAADGEPHGGRSFDTGRRRSPAHLDELLHEAGWHLGGVGVDDVAPKVAVDAGAGQGCEVGSGEQRLRLDVGDVVGRVTVDVGEDFADDGGEFGAHLLLVVDVAA